jgi:hypothetical protein
MSENLDHYSFEELMVARVTLDNWVSQPGWDQLLPGVRSDVFRQSISAAHRAAAAIMQVRYPELIEAGVDNRIRQIQGEKPVKMHMPWRHMPL